MTPIPRNQFPICRDLDGFKREVNGHRLDGVAAGAQTIIEKLQPYIWGHESFSTSPLWILDQFINIDKHRRLVMTLTVAQDMLGEITYGIYGNNAVIFSFDPSNPHLAPLADKMEMEIIKGLSVAFDEPPAANRDVEIVIQSILFYAESLIVPRLSSFLK
jgi:hypothetical protein